MTKILVYGMVVKEEDIPYVKQLFEELDKRSSETKIYSEVQKDLKSKGLDLSLNTISDYKELKEFAPDVILTLGGDGTILNAATLIRDLEIPIMGINLGRLGFLASLEDYNVLDAVKNYFEGNYRIQDRVMIQLESETGLFGDTNFALNECTILKRDTSSMITVHTKIDGQYLNSYWADGLIISTPTGSTGYSLSGGGPIVFPKSGNFLITPVAPHNLNARPIVFSDESEISLMVEGRTENYLCTLDARYETITAEHKIVLRKCPFKTKLIRLESDSFMKTIRNKLAWGLDVRN